MSRVEFAGVRIDQIVCKNHLVRGVHPVERKIITSLQITAHAEKPREVMVHRIVECGRVESILALFAEEELVLILLARQIHRRWKVLRLLIGLPAPAVIDGAESVAGCELAREKEVFLANLGCAVTHCRGEVSLGVYCHLSSLIESKPVDIKHSDDHTGKVLEALADRRHPVPEAVLHRGEFRNLSLVVRMETKGLCVAILVEVGTITALELIAFGVINRESRLVPESGVVAGVVVFISEDEVEVLPLSLV